ncbi:cytochrome P450 [Pisolithus sp. B1]|nr:cytochrome P450 [Pisolithus sp. B1]
MSINTTLHSTGYAASLLDSVQDHVAASPGRAALLTLLYSPIVAVVLNVLRQLLWPRDRSLPPEVFHWIPIVGSAITYGNDPLGFFFKCREKYGDVFTFILFGRKVTVALGPKGNNFVLGGKSTFFSAEDAYTHLTTPVFGKDVVYDVPNEVFMEQKKFVKVGLSIDNFRTYVSMIEEEVELRTTSTIGVASMPPDIMSQITILTASRTLQGKEVRDGLDKSFSELYADLDGGFTPINFLFPNLPLASYRRRDEAHKKMSDFYVDIIRKRKETFDHPKDTQDMIGALQNQQYRNGRQLQDHEIAHIMIALLMAGQHTSSATGSWALLHLAENVQAQESLYKEQVEHFGNSDGTFREMSYEEMRRLPILDSVIRETLRIHPPIHSIFRYRITPMWFPRATMYSPLPLSARLTPRIWPNPHIWDPTRWSDPEGVAAEAFNTYMDESGEKVDFGFGAVSKGTDSPYQPFGAGRHRCIGEQFAYLQLGTILATILRKVEVRLEPGCTFPEHNYHVRPLFLPLLASGLSSFP